LSSRRPPPSALPVSLPPLPRVSVRILRDRTSESSATGGFLNLRRVDLVATRPDGKASPPFSYDVATRASLDAVVMAAHYLESGVRRVFLRSAIRPALALRAIVPLHDGGLWELPAGLIDEHETPPQAAARELAEELGFRVDPGDFLPVGLPVFPSPGLIAEIHYFFHVEVDPRRRETPTEDGSVLEQDACIADVSLEDALEHCRRGSVPDSKTELVLRRLAETLR
jgi:ADP-ribose pyrophosphatase